MTESQDYSAQELAQTNKSENIAAVCKEWQQVHGQAISNRWKHSI